VVCRSLKIYQDILKQDKSQYTRKNEIRFGFYSKFAYRITLNIGTIWRID